MLLFSPLNWWVFLIKMPTYCQLSGGIPALEEAANFLTNLMGCRSQLGMGLFWVLLKN